MPSTGHIFCSGGRAGDAACCWCPCALRVSRKAHHHVAARAAQVAEYENCRLLLVDKKISTARDIVGVLEGAIRGGYPLMIMAEDIEQEALATLVVNKLRGSLKARRPAPRPAPALHPLPCTLCSLRLSPRCWVRCPAERPVSWHRPLQPCLLRAGS